MTTSLAPASVDRPAPAPPRDRLLRAAAGALALWSLAYLLAHVYWALGGEVGLGLLKPSAPELEGWRAINWAASVVLALPALLALALVRVGPGRARAGLLALCLAGTAIAAGHGAYGMVYRGLAVVGLVDVEGRPFTLPEHGWVVWDLVLFEPWFLVEGVLLATVGWTVVRPTARRAWTAGCLAVTALAVLTGLVGVRF